MENCVSEELESYNAKEIIKKVYQLFFWQKKGLLMWFAAVKINRVETS